MADRKGCSERVSNGWHSSPCSRKAVIDRDGKGYCKQHDPVGVAERRAAKQAAWDAEMARQRQHDAARREAARLAAIRGASDAEILAEVERRGLAGSNVALTTCGREAYRLGYHAGHSDTVEGRWTSVPEETWDDDGQLRNDVMGVPHG